MDAKTIAEITFKYVGPNTIGIGASTSFWKSTEDEMYDDRTPISTYLEPNWVIEAREIVSARYSKLDWILGGAKTPYLGKTKYHWTLFYEYAEDSMLKYLDEKTNNVQPRAPFDILTCESSFAYEDTIESHEVLPIEMSRGCQFKCTFCRFPLLGKKKNSYLRRMDLIEKELLDNYERFGVTNYMIIDDTVNESEEKIIELAELAQRLPFELQWVGYNRLDLIYAKPQMIQLLKDSGLRSAYFGMETFNAESGKITGKPKVSREGKDMLLDLKDKWKHDINFYLSFIVGLGNETPDDIDKTQQWCIDNEMHYWNWLPLSLSRSTSVYTPSEFDKNYQKYGYRFPKPLSDVYWENDVWNVDTATVKAKELNSVQLQHGYWAGYVSAALASTLRKPLSEIIKIRKNEKTPNKQMSDDFVKRYIEKHLGPQ
jgi:hypothetical protein